jgi:hypothetical protein
MVKRGKVNLLRVGVFAGILYFLASLFYMLFVMSALGKSWGWNEDYALIFNPILNLCAQSGCSVILATIYDLIGAVVFGLIITILYLIYLKIRKN